jgi:hypothetical protein
LFARAPSRALACRPCAHTRVRRRRAEPLGLSRAHPGSTRTHSPYTARARSRAARPSLGLPKTRAHRQAFFFVRPGARMRALEAHLASAGYPQPRRLPFSPSLNLCETEPCARSRVRAWRAERRRPHRPRRASLPPRRRDTLWIQGAACL